MAEGSVQHLPWHSAPWERLQRSLEASRQHHGLLLEGLPGTGRGQFSVALARRLLCARPREGFPCGSCKSCELAEAGSHPDLRTVTPEEAGKAIGIDAIRGATAFVNATPSLGERKVLLINPAERLTLAAWNAFLKCLEEPAPGTVIIMVSARGHPLPATIRSRCQRVDLPAPTAATAAQWLDDTLGAERMSAPGMERLLQLFAVQPFKVLAYQGGDDVGALGDFLGCIDQALQGDVAPAALRLRAEAAASRLEPDKLLDAAESTLQGWLRARSGRELREAGGQGGFAALETIANLRRARRQGQNPNVELLRSTTVRALLQPLGR